MVISPFRQFMYNIIAVTLRERERAFEDDLIPRDRAERTVKLKKRVGGVLSLRFFGKSLNRVFPLRKHTSKGQDDAYLT